MPNIEYKLFFDNQATSQELLDRFEDIRVEQEVDMAWEARLQLPLCVNDQGDWSGEDEAFLASFRRVRIEIQVADAGFVPLIDGPVVGSEPQMSSEPGQSMLTLIVQDDSFYLHREEKVDIFDNQCDSDIARRIFQQAAEIDSLDIEPTPAPSTSAAFSVVQRGTAMQILRKLAKRQGMHAYVLPGAQAGKSIGAFKKYPTRKDGLPDLVLLGENRNVLKLRVNDCATKPAKTRTAALSLSDGKITTAESNFDSLDLLGTDQSFGDESKTGTRLLSPDYDDSVDLSRAVQAKTELSAFAFEAEGTVISGCYPAVLSPYRVVTVLGTNARLSGDYLLRKVTHTLTRNYYGQNFTLIRNARSAGSRGSVAMPRII